MGKLFTFGCSYSENYDVLYEKYKDSDGTNLPGQVKYIRDFLGGVAPKVWPQVLADLLSMESCNYARGGDCNDGIFEQVCIHSDEFTKDDIVIIQWTHLVRYRWPTQKTWVNYNINYVTFNDYTIPYPSESQHNKIIISRDSDLIVKEVYNWQKIIQQLSKLIGFKLYFWAGCNKIINVEDPSFIKNDMYIMHDCIINRNGIFQETHTYGGESIFHATNGANPDTHMAESGHKVLGKLFYEYITQNENKDTRQST
jgi:hypothetical protein